MATLLKAAAHETLAAAISSGAWRRCDPVQSYGCACGCRVVAEKAATCGTESTPPPITEDPELVPIRVRSRILIVEFQKDHGFPLSGRSENDPSLLLFAS
jgi:hypothetical protein